ncbi:histone-lysine N-methyltransferase EHMT2-like [Artemia franciscana]|uniref:histone-lysine N-methyltransferase EHMT2-like n=1 Tax=Artemia franciscana TaxID=6661 RepID=UPI0032DB0EB2
MERSFFCPICLNELKDPLQTSECKHIFCGYCIKKWLQVNTSCPMDRNAVFIKDLSPTYSYSDERPTSPIIENLLEYNRIYFHPNRIWNRDFSSGKPGKCTALHCAARKGNFEICKLLVSKVATVDVLDSDNRTALYDAVIKNQLHVIEYLLEKGANPNSKDHKCNTVLHIAASKGNLDICKLLVSKGATVDALNSYNRTALFNATKKDQIRVIEYLLEKGADPNSKGHKCNTVLHIAASKGNLDICKLLVSKGATVDALNSYNRTALFYAAKKNQIRVIEYLLEKGAKRNSKVHKCRIIYELNSLRFKFCYRSLLAVKNTCLI